jgi:hypothetical protein
MSRTRAAVFAGLPLLGALLLSALHAAGLQAMDGLGVAESLLSPTGAAEPWMVLMALGFVGARLAAILAVPGLVAVAAYAALAGLARPTPGDGHEGGRHAA